MKVGILTLPLHTNYGGILQAYALQTVLERMGHEVVVFQNGYDGIRRFPFYKMPFIWGKRILWDCFKGRHLPVFLERRRKRELPVITQHTKVFINTYIHTCQVRRLSDIRTLGFDAIVVGSDQIWRREYFRRIWRAEITDAYLGFMPGKEIKRIAYAVSFGKNSWDYSKEETAVCRALAGSFNAISVREDAAVDLCQRYLGAKAEHVLDPTLLLSRLDYIDLIQRADVASNSGKLFAYILDNTPGKTAFVNRVAEKSGTKPYYIDCLSVDYSKPIEKRIVPPVESWLRGFFDAELVVTDSFHGCVFSIVFGKPFIAIGNVNRGLSRFESLLRLFGAENRLITDLDNCDLSIICSDNLEEREERLLDLKRKSLDFLSQALRDNP